MGFITLLQILFIGLRLAHVIDWSWWIVMSPYLLSTLVLMVLGAVALGAIATGSR